MAARKIRVLQWGLGAMGSGMVNTMLDKELIKVVGAFEQKRGIGDDLGKVLGIKKKLGIKVETPSVAALKKAKPDVVIQAINSFTKECFDEMKLVVEAGFNLITIAEEMALPEAQNPALAKKLDQLAKKKKVTILGTGINPGFILDAQVVMLSAACLNVKRVEASRINDLSPFGPTVMETQGVGTTPAQFRKGIKNGDIVGHIGFQESIKMIADGIGLKIDKIKETRKPIISKVYRETPHVKVEPGMVAGCEHTGVGYYKGKAVIKLIHPQQIHPHLEEVNTGDYINIIGDPEVHMSIKPEIPGGKGTMAMAVNSIPLVFNASPGLKRMIDLPIPSCLMGKSAYERRV